MKIKVLGTQSPFNTEGHNCPGFMIENGDKNFYHYTDLFNLLYASFVFKRQKKISEKINVYLPSTPKLTYEDIINEKDSFAKFDIITEEKEILVDNIKITFSKNDHPVETYSVKITDGIQTIVYTADTSYSSKNKIIKFSKDAEY
ncbi:hypothetical protein LY90DRAFT_669219 [Neocallimastix californiae]|uniref:Uncharacterized protein n=1 Tax=Neocallimastix californiae TaxID=1754190 RepID=A0A1Y2DDQ4_9FUNG|nr:hypothetical protein LY90DRAFT_669219 [Neocallimastix californiae]|eukprot:ORY57388.1 hypothetical protein LY90DRAFT_669219 [Neocallimastix californiae]